MIKNLLQKSAITALEKFLRHLHNPPDQKDIRINIYAKKSKYLPISFIEMQLDQTFFGLWQTMNFQHSTIMNELVGSIELKVFHPVLKEWITRTGTAATPIQLQASDSETIIATDTHRKILNTLVKDYPHLKADCIKNAAKSLGKVFGRDLNRKFEDNYTPFINLPENQPCTDNQLFQIENLSHHANLSKEEEVEMNEWINQYERYTIYDAETIIARLQTLQPKTLDQQFKDHTNDARQ